MTVDSPRRLADRLPRGHVTLTHVADQIGICLLARMFPGEVPGVSSWHSGPCSNCETPTEDLLDELSDWWAERAAWWDA